MMNRIFEDNFRHKGLRKKMIDEIRNQGIDDESVLEAMMNVPRHYFFDKEFLSQAYNSDVAFQIGTGQTISRPFTVAYQTTLLNIQKGEKVLEIGTGSGYQSCVLLEMGAKVFTIERMKELFDKTKKLLNQIDYNPKMFYGDGYLGLPGYAPFDKILITCGAPEVPQELLKQLKVGGVIVIPIGQGVVQKMTVIIKNSESDFEKHELKEFRFVPMLQDKNWNK